MLLIYFKLFSQEQARREKEELEKMLEENRRRVEESQKREALEQQRREEERYRELEQIQRQKEEALRRKKQEEEEERANQMKLLGKNKSRPKLSFALGSKWFVHTHLIPYGVGLGFRACLVILRRYICLKKKHSFWCANVHIELSSVLDKLEEWLVLCAASPETTRPYGYIGWRKDWICFHVTFIELLWGE